MSTTVYTRSVCDRCGVSDDRVGLEDTIPNSWSRIVIEIRHDTAKNWENSSIVRRELCQNCTAAVREFLDRVDGN